MGIKTKTFLFLGISLFFILGVFGVSHADYPTGSYDYNNYYYNDNYNYGSCSGSSCYNPADYEGTCTTCSPSHNYNANVTGQACQNGQCAVACECSSGPCCDGCHFKSATTSCNSETKNEYGCPWGSTCGSDVGVRTKTRYQYCAGNSNQCTGNWGNWLAPGSWQVSAACSTGQICIAGNSACQASSTCVRAVPSYFKHYKKTCFDGSSYWFDSNNSRNDKYQDCADGNDCTIDSCPASSCVNELKCDGTTCAVDSQDYCGKCSRCGDGVCSCGETSDTCLADCKTLNGLPFSIFENTNSNSQWVKNVSIKAGEKVNFLAVVSNNEKDAVNNVVVKMNVPNELSIGSIKIDGNALSGDIRSGINIGTLASKQARAITFTADAPASLSQNTANVAGTITADNISAPSTDSIQLAFTDSSSNIAVQPKTGTGTGLTASPAAGTGLTASLSGMFRSKYFLPILIAIIVGLFIIRMIYLSFFRK